MARTVEFDREDILQKAMDVFWQEGYCKSSVSCLVAATKLKPGSIYAAFGSKEGLFLAALDLYSQQSIQKLTSCLKIADTPLQGLRVFIETIVEGMLGSKEQRGCFLVNTVLEISPGKTIINTAVKKHLKAIESHLVSALSRAKDEGELAADQNPEVLAQYILVNIWGLQVLAKTKPDNDTIRSMLAQILSCIPV